MKTNLFTTNLTLYKDTQTLMKQVTQLKDRMDNNYREYDRRMNELKKMIQLMSDHDKYH